MNVKEAMEIFEMDADADLTSMSDIKKKYHALALQYHPDKNNNDECSKEIFQQINEAYECLQREIPRYQHKEKEREDEDPNNYIQMLKTFVEGLWEGKSELFSTIVSDIVMGCKTLSLTLFERLDKETSLEMYMFLSKYKMILHISQETLEKVKEIVLEKCASDQIFFLNPGLEDLLQNNVYVLEHGGQSFFVPLWYSELVFDAKEGGEIIVKCIPELPENVTIDEYNNLIVKIELAFTLSLFEEKSRVVYVGGKKFTIPLEKMKWKCIQRITFPCSGITKTNDSDFHSTEPRGNVTFHITFV